MSLLATFNIGATGLVAQSLRLNTTASNIANIDSVSGPDGKPYRSRQVVFVATQPSGQPGSGVAVTQIVESTAPLRREYKPGHPNVNPTEEMVNMISASRSYQMNIEAMNVTRQLMMTTMDLGK